MNSNQFRRHLASHGCTFEPGAGKGGHIVVRRGDKVSVLPTHGGSKQLGTGLIKTIMKQLDIKD